MTKRPNIEVLTTIPFPEPVMQRLKAINPRIKITLSPAQSINDISPEIWGRTEVLYTDVLIPPLNLVPKLRWVQFHYAGIDYVLAGWTAAEVPVIGQSVMAASAAVRLYLADGLPATMNRYNGWTAAADSAMTTQGETES